MKTKRIVIPHEHGGWAMVSVPFLFGMMAGEPQWMHLPLFLGWLFLYLSSYPFLQFLKRTSNREHWLKWGLIYGAVSILCLIPSVILNPSLFYFGPLLLGLLMVNIWHTIQKSERAMLNNICAILIFSVGGPAAYLLSGGSWDRMMALIMLFSFLHFMGSVFFVKSVFRERKSVHWINYARLYHVLVLLIPFIVGIPWMFIPFTFSSVRTFIFAGKILRPWKVGIIEIMGAVQFLVLSVVLIQHG